MRDLSKLTAEEMLDLTAEIMEPMTEIMSDKAVAAANAEGNVTKAIPLMIRNHKTACLQLLAAMDGVPVSELHLKPLTMMMRITELYSMEDMQDFLPSSADQEQQIVSGSATATIEGAEN